MLGLVVITTNPSAPQVEPTGGISEVGTRHSGKCDFLFTGTGQLQVSPALITNIGPLITGSIKVALVIFNVPSRYTEAISLRKKTEAAHNRLTMIDLTRQCVNKKQTDIMDFFKPRD